MLAAAIAVRGGRGAGVRPTAWRFLEFPAVLALLALTVFGAPSPVSALAVHFGDVRDVVGNLLTLAFFLTPVLYPVEAVPERWRGLLRANPFATFFSGLHDTLFFFRPVRAADWAWMAGTAAVCRSPWEAPSSSVSATRWRRRHERARGVGLRPRRRPRSTAATRGVRTGR